MGLPLVLTGVFLALAGLHVYWGLGGRWPGHDEESLVQQVVGGPPGTPMPSLAACIAVASALVLGAGVIVARAGLFPIPVPALLLRMATFGIAAVLLLRGIGGFFFVRLRPQLSLTPFARLNALVYSPLCVALGLAALWLAR